MTSRVLLMLVLSLCTASASGDPYAYECKILTDSKLGDDGKLTKSNLDIYLGATFQVERESGVVLGGYIGNSSYETRKVLSPGTDEWSFVAIWYSAEGQGGGRNTAYLAIKEWQEGLEKPFVFASGPVVLTGVCT